MQEGGAVHVRFVPGSPDLVVSAGSDAHCRIWDVRAGQVRLLAHAPWFASSTVWALHQRCREQRGGHCVNLLHSDTHKAFQLLRQAGRYVDVSISVVYARTLTAPGATGCTE